MLSQAIKRQVTCHMNSNFMFSSKMMIMSQFSIRHFAVAAKATDNLTITELKELGH